MGRFKQIFAITIPSVKPTMMMLILLGVGRIFYSDFGLFYQVPMNSGQLFSVTNTIDTYVYRGLMQFNNISMSSAAASYQAIVGFILIVFVNWLVRRFDRDSALF
jgi:putative aldouronate transport system permease protein